MGRKLTFTGKAMLGAVAELLESSEKQVCLEFVYIIPSHLHSLGTYVTGHWGI
jgi:hypothetical protein